LYSTNVEALNILDSLINLVGIADLSVKIASAICYLKDLKK
jgi:hypothetical protein